MRCSQEKARNIMRGRRRALGTGFQSQNLNILLRWQDAREAGDINMCPGVKKGGKVKCAQYSRRMYV